MKHYQQLYIGGEWTAPAGQGHIDVLSASTEEVIGKIPEGTPTDVDRAVAAARKAFDGGWSETSKEERGEWLTKLAAALKERATDMATTISQEVGTPIAVSGPVQAGLPVFVTESYAKMIRDFVTEQEVGNSLVAREPFGVVGAITPWNYPLHQIMNKVAPALAAGCTVVLKPSEIAPLNAYLLAEACIAIGLPHGVLNIVAGTGPVVGAAIAPPPGSDLVGFPGQVPGRTACSVSG